MGSSYADKTIKVEYFEVTVFKPPSPSRPVPFFLGGLPEIAGNLIAHSLIALMEEKRETLIVVCEIRGSVAGRSFKGSSDRVIPDPKADLAKAVSDVVREAIDDSADGLIKAFP